MRLDHLLAVAVVDGPAAGLTLLDEVAADPRLARDHRVPAVRAHLVERSGDRAGVRATFLAAAGLAVNPMQQRYLAGRASALT